MLCTPPAFILSQDQTLECLYLILPRGRVKSWFELDCSLLFVWVVFLSELSSSVHAHTWISPCSMLVLSSCCSIFNDRSLLPFFAEPDYYITALSVCQPLFWNFFKFLFRGFLPAASCGQLFYFTTFFSVCQPLFSNFFQKISKNFFQKILKTYWQALLSVI